MKLSKAQKVTLAFFAKYVQVGFVIALLAAAFTDSISDAIFVYISVFALIVLTLSIPFLVTSFIALLLAHSK